MAEDVTLAELGRLIGRLEHSLEQQFKAINLELADHSSRIHALEEASIRADERRRAAREYVERAVAEDAHGRVSLQRWQLIVAALAAVAAVVVAIIQAV